MRVGELRGGVWGGTTRCGRGDPSPAEETPVRLCCQCKRFRKSSKGNEGTQDEKERRPPCLHSTRPDAGSATLHDKTSEQRSSWAERRRRSSLVSAETRPGTTCLFLQIPRSSRRLFRRRVILWESRWTGRKPPVEAGFVSVLRDSLQDHSVTALPVPRLRFVPQEHAVALAPSVPLGMTAFRNCFARPPRKPQIGDGPHAARKTVEALRLDIAL